MRREDTLENKMLNFTTQWIVLQPFLIFFLAIVELFGWGFDVFFLKWWSRQCNSNSSLFPLKSKYIHEYIFKARRLTFRARKKTTFSPKWQLMPSSKLVRWIHERHCSLWFNSEGGRHFSYPLFQSGGLLSCNFGNVGHVWVIHQWVLFISELVYL